MSVGRMNLSEIERTLKKCQVNFARINKSLSSRRSAMTDEVMACMMEGYRFVDEALAEGVDLLALGNSTLLLQLNSLVLLGAEESRRNEFLTHLEETHQYFYNDVQGAGIGALMKWQDYHHNDSLWHKAAGLYIHILSQPQLFIEGNHRTAILLVSYMLVRDGHPPFVLAPKNAKRLLDQSKRIGALKKNSLGMLFRFASIRNDLAGIFRDNLKPRHLIIQQTHASSH